MQWTIRLFFVVCCLCIFCSQVFPDTQIYTRVYGYFTRQTIATIVAFCCCYCYYCCYCCYYFVHKLVQGKRLTLTPRQSFMLFPRNKPQRDARECSKTFAKTLCEWGLPMFRSFASYRGSNNAVSDTASRDPGYLAKTKDHIHTAFFEYLTAPLGEISELNSRKRREGSLVCASKCTYVRGIPLSTRW